MPSQAPSPVTPTAPDPAADQTPAQPIRWPASAIWKLIRTTVPKRLWSADPICPHCSYSLRGLPSEGICPECGTSYTGDSAHLSASRTREQLRRVLIFYGAWCFAFPVAVGLFGPTALVRSLTPITPLCAFIIALIASARLVGALVALVIESHTSRSAIWGLLLLF